MSSFWNIKSHHIQTIETINVVIKKKEGNENPNRRKSFKIGRKHLSR